MYICTWIYIHGYIYIPLTINISFEIIKILLKKS